MDRSPLLLSAADCALLIIDVQEVLIKVIPDGERVVWNLQRLAAAARVMGVPCLATEQYPEKLGTTVATLQTYLPAEVPSKMSFSCGGCADFESQLTHHARRQVLLGGVETHVCVQQTSLDLLTAGYDVFLAVDAVASRHTIDYETALRRLEISGVTLTTTESVLFEWCTRAGTPEFKEISAIVKSTR